MEELDRNIVKLRAERRKNDGGEDGCEFGWCIEVYIYWSVHHYHSAHHHLTFLTSSNLTLPSCSLLGKRSSIPAYHVINWEDLTCWLRKAVVVPVLLYCFCLTVRVRDESEEDINSHLSFLTTHHPPLLSRYLSDAFHCKLRHWEMNDKNKKYLSMLFIFFSGETLLF